MGPSLRTNTDFGQAWPDFAIFPWALPDVVFQQVLDDDIDRASATATAPPRPWFHPAPRQALMACGAAGAMASSRSSPRSPSLGDSHRPLGQHGPRCQPKSRMEAVRAYLGISWQLPHPPQMPAFAQPPELSRQHPGQLRMVQQHPRLDVPRVGRFGEVGRGDEGPAVVNHDGLGV